MVPDFKSEAEAEIWAAERAGEKHGPVGAPVRPRSAILMFVELTEKATSRVSSAGARWSAIAGLAFLVACATQGLQPMQMGVYHVAFGTDSFGIDTAGQQTIDMVANLVKANTAASITIVGRTDATGTPAFNMQLSQKRAIAVHDALIATGKIAPDQIETAWTSEKPEVAGAASTTPPPGSRIVDIFIH